MVRAVLAPMPIEVQFIKRVRYGNEQGLLKQVVAPMRGPALRGCLCEDGRPGIAIGAPSVTSGLGHLYGSGALAREVELQEFSCMRGPRTMAEWLIDAELVDFDGVHIQHVAHQTLKGAMSTGPLLELLRDRIH